MVDISQTGCDNDEREDPEDKKGAFHLTMPEFQYRFPIQTCKETSANLPRNLMQIRAFCDCQARFLFVNGCARLSWQG